MINPDKFEMYEIIIKTGQMSQEDVPSFLNKNPEFARWYHARNDAHYGNG